MDQQKQPFNPLLAVLAALAALFFVFPLIGMITGAPWGNVFGIITNKSSLDALGLSIIASLASTVIALLFGFPLAWILARNSFRGKSVGSRCCSPTAVAGSSASRWTRRSGSRCRSPWPG
jgi:ABC-type sulfate transport system permease component